jgi:hypothetical protein
MKKNNDKIEVIKPKSMILDEIRELEEKKEESSSILAKLKYSAQIHELSLQLIEKSIIVNVIEGDER